MWLIIQPCTPTVPAVQYLSRPDSSYQQYQYQQSSTCSTGTRAVPAAENTHSRVRQLPNANNVIGTTYQHNTDTTMGITITDNLVDTTLYQDH